MMSTYERLCGELVKRCGELGLKGRRRDDEAISFLCGAIAALRIAGLEDEADKVQTICALIVQTRGYASCEKTWTSARSAPAAA